MPAPQPPPKPENPKQTKMGGKIDERNEECSLQCLNEPQEAEQQQEWTSFLTGARLQVVNIGIMLALLLAMLEATIVSTSIVSITDELSGLSRSSWIVTAYLLTFTGFTIVLAKLSDIFGRKLIISFSLILFIAFSIGCGVVSDLDSLIICRAFQGIGGGGMYGMTFVVLPEMVDTEGYAFYASLVAAVSAIANLLGPLLGGVINNNTTWKWVFLFNAPVGFVSLVLIFFSLPKNFPKRPQDSVPARQLLSKKYFNRIDFVGAFIVLAATVLLVTGLEEGGVHNNWKSATAISLLVVAVVLWVALFVWERFQETRVTAQEPVFPWRLAKNRFFMGAMLNTFFGGATFLGVVIYLPQRFQVVYGDSPFKAGYRLLAVTLALALGSAISGILVQKRSVPLFYVFLSGGLIQVLGLALMGTLIGTETTAPGSLYAFEVIIGLGSGFCISTAVMMVPLAVEPKDVAVAMGIVAQFRMFGGAIGVALGATALNKQLTSRLSNVLTPEQLEALLLSFRNFYVLPKSLQTQVRVAFAESMNIQMNVFIAFGGAAVLSALLLWEKNLRRQAKPQ